MSSHPVSGLRVFRGRWGLSSNGCLRLALVSPVRGPSFSTEFALLPPSLFISLNQKEVFVGVVGRETTAVLETKEFCGAAWPSKELKESNGIRTACRTTTWGFYVPLYSFAVQLGNLERQLQSKLNLSRCRNRAQNRAGAGVHHACGQQSSPVCLVGYPEVRMVEDVEHLGAEVQRLGLPQCELLEEREIAAHEFRANQRRSEEHTSELQSRLHLVCRLLLEKKKKHV